MAIPVSSSEGQELVLDINGHNEVYIACKPVSVHWRDLGARLGVLQYALDTIEVDCNGKVEKCMSAMLEKWLRRPLGEVQDDVKPTWNSLCVALSHIDRPLAERLAEKHDCGDISVPVSDVTQPSNVNSPAFLPQMCGCGKCTIIGWRSGDACQLVRYSKYPKLLVIDCKNSSASLFKQSYDKHATLFHETSRIIELFRIVNNQIWGNLFESVENQRIDLAKIIRTLRIGLEVQLPMFPDLDSLQNHCHSLRISWYNFKPLHLLVTQVLAKLSPTLLADWNNYLTIFKEYCSARNLRDYSNVFFRVEEHNIFLLEIDEHYYNFTLSNIEDLCNSLSIALGCPSVCLHLVTVRGGSLIIYLYYSYSDYLIVFQSLTTEQLKMISQIKTYRILSLTDLHNQFRYDNIRSYAEAPPQSSVKSLISSEASVSEMDDTNEEETTEAKLLEEVQMLKKQSFYKDVELTRARNELTCAHKKILEKEEEGKELKRELDFTKVDVTMAKAELLKADEDNRKMKEELQELKAQILSIESTSSKRELELAIQKLKEELQEHKAQILSTEGTSSKRELELVNQKLKDTTDHSELYIACKPVSAHWRDLGARLGVLQNTLATIEADCNGKVEKCMSAMLEKWLRTPLGEVHDDVKPTWKSLCVALSHIDRALAERLAEEYDCGDIRVPEMSIKPVKTIAGLRGPRGVAASDDGDIVVAEYGAHCVTIVNKEGEKVRSFGAYGTKEGQFTYPRGVAITNDGHLLVTDQHRLQKLTFDGVCKHSVGSSISGSGQLLFNTPRGLTVHPTTGLVFVVDSYNNRIQVFNSDLTYAHSITLHGDELFNRPYDVSLDSNGFVYVAEWDNHCITKLTTTGEYITRFGSKGSAPGQLGHPSSLSINNNLVYVGEEGNSRVSVFDTNGTFLHFFGKRGSGEGEFQSPRNITTDTFGNLYVSDFGNNRLVVY